MSRMSDHVADDALSESDEDDDSSGSPSRSRSSSQLAGSAVDNGPGTSGSSGGPYSALTRSLGVSPRGEGEGKSFHHQQQLSSDTDSSDGEIEFG